MLLRLVIILISTLLPQVGYSQSTCQVTSSYKDNFLTLKDSAEELERATQIELAEQDPANFCKRNMMLRFINANPRSSRSEKFQCNSMSESDLEQYATQIYARELDSARAIGNARGWFSSLIQVPAAQHLTLLNEDDYWKDGIKSSKELANGLYEKVYQTKLDQLEKSFSMKPTHFFKHSDFDKLDDDLEIKNPDGFFSQFKSKMKEYLGAVKLCNDLSNASMVQCSIGLNKIINMAKPEHLPASNNAISLPGVWKKVLSSDKDYSEGLRRVSLKIIGKLKAKHSKGTNIFDDLVNSFQESGFSKEKATDATFEVLSLYGNGGGNLGDRAFDFKRWGNYTGACQEPSSICHSLDLIGRALPILDYFNSKNKMPLYSFPKGVKAKCNTNKSYHFWMAAYLSRQLKKDNYSSDAASDATYAASFAYQLNRDKGVPNSPVQHGMNTLRKSPFDPVINIMRADLAYSKAGADFGANQKNISVDQNLTVLMKSSPGKTSDLSEIDSVPSDLQRYQRLSELLAPGALSSGK